MSSPRVTTLFTQSSDDGRRPASIVLSIVLHGFLGTILWFGFTYKPPFTRVVTEHLPVRELDLVMPDDALRAANAIPYPVPKLAAHTAPRANAGSAAPAPAPQSSANPKLVAPPSPTQPAPPPPPQVEQVKNGPQTLVQADLPATIALKDEVPVPQVMIWSPTKEPAKKIVPPQPQQQAAADVKPTLAKPNQEIPLADVNLASSNHPALTQPVTPSSTTPVAIPNKPQAPSPPVMTTQPTEQAIPAAVLSLSDLHTKTAVLPPVSESVAAKAPAPPSPNQSKDSTSGSGNSAATGKTNNSSQPSVATNSIASTGTPGNGTKPTPGTTASASNGQGSGPQQKSPGNGTSSGAKPDTASASTGLETPLGDLAQPPVTQMTMPRDGHFSAVIIGNSLEDKYPEIANVWHGRVAYTAYLHVGLAKSWILQYSLPRNAEASDGGTIDHLEAPWPYNIVRPNLTTGSLDADALMVHGYVNQAGHFETLNIVFPETFSQAQFVLAALQKWTFRPALQNGQAARVEVLIIIPDTYE